MTSFYITLASNASTNIYQSNTLTNFRNTLPHAVELKDFKWQLALQSLCLNTRFSNASKPKIIKIRILEISDILGGSGYHQDIACIAFNNNPDNSAFYHVVKKKEYFPLRSTNLQSLTVQLTDEKNRELSLLSGQPTFVHVKLKRMSSPSFIIRVNAHEGNQIFPANTQSNFQVQLCHPIDLTIDKWEVALSSIHFPMGVDISGAFSKEDFWIYIHSYDGNNINHPIFVEREQISDERSLLDAINKKARVMLGNNDILFSMNEDKRCTLTLRKPMSLKFSDLFCHVLGKDIMRVNQVTAEKPQQIVFPNKVNLDRCKPNVMLLYCNFITPSIIGDQYAKILKLIPITEKPSSTYTTYDCEHLDFFPLSTNFLSMLDFQLQDSSGKDIIFVNKQDTVLINLIFQHKK